MTASIAVAERPSMRKDERGAVMLIGLFMAMSLIGALWTVIGIGDALVYRDKVQEVADHVAFTSATVHARGMNFVAAVNLIMLAIVAVYLVIDLIDKVLNVTDIISDVLCDIIWTSEAGCPIYSWADPEYTSWDEYRDEYYDEMKPVLIGLSWSQTLVGMAAPYGGLVAGAGVADKYKESAMTLSTAMIPSFALTGGITNGSYDFSGVMNGSYGNGSTSTPSNQGTDSFSMSGIDTRIGLPISNEKMNKLCIYASNYTMQWMEGWLSEIPVIGNIMNFDSLTSAINSIIGSEVADISCNEYEDSFWKRDGPKKPYQKNGSDWHQVFAVVFPGSFKEQSESKVAMAKGPQKGLGVKDSVPNGLHYYIAQAEFYFDCDSTWTDPVCNGGGGATEIPHALYSMRWMARLRRVHYPNLGGMFVQWMTGIFQSNNVLGPLKGEIANSEWYQSLSQTTNDLSNEWGGSVGGYLAGSIFGDLANGKEGALLQNGNGGGMLDTGVAWLANKIPNMQNPPSTAMIH